MYSTSAHVAPHPRTNPLRDVTSAMRGVRRPHNPRIQHDGIQEECSDEENEHSLMKYMHHDSEEKPEKPERRSGQGRPPKQKALPYHWLQPASLQRVNSMLATMENVSKQMVVELEAAERSPVVGPAMLTICKAVKRRFDDAVDRLSFHKSINREKHTPSMLKASKIRVTDARKQFGILRKILKLKYPVNQAADEAADEAV